MTEKDLRTVIGKVLAVPADEINDATSPDNVAGWDSIKAMNIVFAIEDETGVEFTDEQIESMLTYRLIRLAVEDALGQALEPGD